LGCQAIKKSPAGKTNGTFQKDFVYLRTTDNGAYTFAVTGIGAIW
jgi:hypothetical protein